MNPTEIEFAVTALVAEPFAKATFVFDLIAIYNTSKVTVSKLKHGQTNAIKTAGDVLWKTHLYFRATSPTDDVAVVGDELVIDPLTATPNPDLLSSLTAARRHSGGRLYLRRPGTGRRPHEGDNPVGSPRSYDESHLG